MYTQFYGFTAMPFQLTPDSRFFFGSDEHNKAMAFLNYGISQGEGLVVVTGEVGAGKTTLVDHLLSILDSGRYVAGRIVTTQLNSYDMLRMVASAFNIFREGADKATLINQIRQLFAGLHSHGKRALLIVDEAQSLTTEALEELRMLSNLVVSGQTPFQIILLGQPEFRATLSSPDLEQVRQRIAASCHLGPLSEEDTRLYIEHRLKQVGWHGDPDIEPAAFSEIYRSTGGIPRRINTLCSRLLLLGFLDQSHEITARMVIGVAGELSKELGPMATGSTLRRHTGVSELTATPATPAKSNLEPRLAALEIKLERLEKVVDSALDIAANYIPAAKV